MTTKLTDVQLRAWLKKRPSKRRPAPDGTVPGLSIRVGPQAMTWTLKLRVKGEGGVSARGFKIKGKMHRITLGEYPDVTLEAARGTANIYVDQAKKGISPVKALESAATAGGPTVAALGTTFIADYVKMRELRALRKYEMALDVHIVPLLGPKLADLLTREDVRDAVKKVMVKKPRGSGSKDRPRGGKEAARTFVSILRQMIGWGMEEKKLTRKDNPVSGMEKNLPKKRKGERVLSPDEARDAWRAAGDLGYPFGPVYQLSLLTADRRGEWSQCTGSYLDFVQAIQVVPARGYKSDHVHVMPLVPQAVEILKWVLAYHARSNGPYIFSGTDGARPLQGWSKAQKRMMDAIYANTGIVPKKWTPHDMRRTVATRVAEATGEAGDKMVKRVLGHTEEGATTIYNRYAYVKEMRRVLTEWANELLATEKMVYVCPDSRLFVPGGGAIALPLAA